MTALVLPDVNALATLTRPELLEMAENLGGVEFAKTARRKVIANAIVARMQEINAEKAIEGLTEQPTTPPGEPENVVARLRAYLADPGAATPEEAAELGTWMQDAPRDRYAEVIDEVKGIPKPADRAPAREAADPVEDAEPETGVEIQPWNPESGRAAALLPSVSTWAQIQTIAQDLGKAVALPVALRNKPADIALLLLTGRDLGVAPTQALNKIYVIDGKPSMAPELMRALVIDRGHDCWFEDVGPLSATCCFHRKEWPPERVAKVTWTLEDAKTAKLIQSYDSSTGAVTPMEKKPAWRNYPRALLKARATSEVLRDNAPDVLAGVSYTPEELDSDVDGQGAPIRVQSTSSTESTRPPAAPPAPPAPTPEQVEKQKQMDADAITAGWESYPAEAAAHGAVRELIAENLNDEQKEQARAMREEKGWPMRPKPQFDAFHSWVKRCIAANKAEAAPTPAGKKNPVSDAAREALAEAEGKVGKGVPSGGDGRPTETVTADALNEPADAEIVCAECGMAGTTPAEIEHEIGCSLAVAG